MNQEFVDKQSQLEMNKYTKHELDLFRRLIINNRDIFFKNIKVSERIIEEHEKILWKDFLIYFKRVFEEEIGGMYTPKIGHVLRELLHIDQELHVRKGLQLTCREWFELYN